MIGEQDATGPKPGEETAGVVPDVRSTATGESLAHPEEITSRLGRSEDSRSPKKRRVLRTIALPSFPEDKEYKGEQGPQ